MTEPEATSEHARQANALHHPATGDVPEAIDRTGLSFKEIIKQAFSLIFQLQKKQGLKRATDLLETNPGSVIIAGILAAILFFALCYGGMRLALYLSGVELA